MCELFGFSAREPEDIRPELEALFSHSREHPHGWGMAWLEGDRLRLEKEPVRARDSKLIPRLLEQPLNSPMVLAHIRLATIGNIELRNCHPYTSRDLSGHRWVQIHNGTIFHFPPMDKHYAFTDSDTDSASMLSWFLMGIGESYRKKFAALTRKERFSLLEEMIAEISPGNKVNLLLYDDDLFYVHTNMAGTLFYRETAHGTMFATVPLDGEEWKPVPMTRLLAYDRGELVLEGKSHDHVYEDDPEKYRLLYLSYAAL